MKRINEKPQSQEKATPDIFAYHDYRTFLSDWFAHLKRQRNGDSMRDLATKAGVSCAYFPSVLKRTRKMSADVLEALIPNLKLNQGEAEYLSLLRSLSDASSPDARRRAFEQIQKTRKYRNRNPKEVEVFHYLDNWYYVAIRELAQLPDFTPEAKWIAARLGNRITVQQAQQAVNFLLKSGHLEIDESGKVRPKEKDIKCIGGVFRIAIGSFHQQMIQLSTDILRDVKSDEHRHVTSYTLAIAPEDFPKLREILEKSIDQVEQLSRGAKNASSVYHVTMMGVPLTAVQEGSNGNKRRK